jgi:hypothetical protein
VERSPAAHASNSNWFVRTQSQLWRIIISAIATPQVQISPDHPFKLLIQLAYRPAVKRHLAQVPGLTRKCALDLIC